MYCLCLPHYIVIVLSPHLCELGVRNEGWFDPWTLLSAFKRKAAEMGVAYLHGDVVGVGVEAERVTGVEVCLQSNNTGSQYSEDMLYSLWCY